MIQIRYLDPFKIFLMFIARKYYVAATNIIFLFYYLKTKKIKTFSLIHLFYFFIPLNYEYKFHEYGLVSIYIKVILISTMHRAPICKFH